MGTLWELWSEISHDSDSLADPVLLECLQAGQTHRIFDDITDDNLKSVLSMINSLLNDTKSREKGATVFNQMILSVKITRLIGFQDTLISSLHLICKNISSHIAQTALVNFLPHCKDLPDVNQIVVSSIIPKAMSHCVEEFQDVEEGRQPGAEVIQLIRICLEKYRGPCGNFRDRLEKAFVPLLDHENGDLVNLICNVLPLLSSTGGGGSHGDKHSKDWNLMITKLMKSTYDCLYQLYSDYCPTLEEENPFERDNPGLTLPSILQPKVFLRISLLKRRLNNLLCAISSYLRIPFPAQKPVPVKSILKIISHLVSVNLMDFFNTATSKQKEAIFLAALIPSVHSCAFKLLDSLVLSLGTNLLPDATVVEQIFSQEWKWIDAKKKSFESVKLEMYSSLTRWLKTTHGHTSDVKTLKMWTEFLLKDISLEKETVELKLLPKSKKEKKQFKVQALTVLNNSTSANTFISKNSKLCEAALDILQLLIPSLDSTIHKAVYNVLGKTQVQVYRLGTFASPYDDSNCRGKLNSCLLELVVNPNPISTVSVGLIINLLRKGFQDPVTSVSHFCQSAMSILERVVHPANPSLDFSSLNVISENGVNNANSNSFTLQNDSLVEDKQDDEEEEEEEVEKMDTGCQTEVESITLDSDAEDDNDVEEVSKNSKDNLDNSDLRKIMAELQSLKESVIDLKKSSSSNVRDRPSTTGATCSITDLINSLTPQTLFTEPTLSPIKSYVTITNGHNHTTSKSKVEIDGEFSRNKRKLKENDEEDSSDVIDISDDDEDKNTENTRNGNAKKLRRTPSPIEINETMLLKTPEKITSSEGNNVVTIPDELQKQVSEELAEMLDDFIDQGLGD